MQALGEKCWKKLNPGVRHVQRLTDESADTEGWKSEQKLIQAKTAPMINTCSTEDMCIKKKKKKIQTGLFCWLKK